METSQLSEIYETYITQMETVLKKASAFDGLWGFGNDPKKDPCHMKFYEDVCAYIDSLVQRAPAEEEAFAAADWIIRTPLQHENKAVYWCMIAVHGPCKKLIPLISPACCGQLRRLYEDSYRRRDHLPVQQDLYKSLKKRSGKF